MRQIPLLLILLSCCAFHAEADSSAPLSWQDCVRLAARNNPDLLSALQAVESNRAQYKGSWNGVLPHLSLSNSYTDSSSSHSGLLTNGAVGTVSTESKLWQLEGVASLDLIDLGQWASIETAAAQLRESQASLKETASNVLLSLYKAFTGVLYAQEEIQVNTHIRDTWRSNAEMISLRYDSGAESKGNKMNTQAQLMQAEMNLLQAGRDVHSAQQQLSQALGLDQFQALVATGAWSTTPVPMPEPDFDQLLVREPPIQLQEAVLDQTRAALKSAHSTIWPTFSLDYAKGTQGGAELPGDPFWTFTGVVNYPLFGGGLTSTYYASQAARRTYEKAQLDLRAIRNQTRTTLETAWSAFAQAHDQVEVQRAFLDAAQQRKEEYDVLYQSGLQSFEEWILVVQDYVNSQMSFLKAEQNLMLAEAQWRFARGEQLGESL